MVTLDDVMLIFKDSKPTKGDISMESLTLLTSIGRLSIGIDKDIMEYYYALPLEDILSQNNIISIDTLQELVDSGWSLNKSKTQIIKYI